MLKTHLVIVGGGFAGLSLARSLKHVDRRRLRITIVSDSASFRYCPALYRVTVGHREREAIIPISEIIDDLPHVSFVHSRALHIDRDKRTIHLSGDTVLHYDYAVLALGVVTSYFNIPGIEANSYGIKTPHDIRELRHHLHQTLIDEHMPDKNYVVVGAGPTGVETAAALGSYMKRVARRHGLKRNKVNISVIESASRPLPMLSEKASQSVVRHFHKLGIRLYLHTKVEAETETSLQANGKSIPTKTVIWTAGTTNNPFYAKNASQFSFNERGKVIVDEFLRVDSRTFVIGDNAETPYSGLAFTAVHDARYVAKHIASAALNRPYFKTYKPLKPIAIVPAGKSWAVLNYGSFSFDGRFASLLRTLADFIGYKDVLGWRKALHVMIKQDDTDQERCYLCQAAIRAQNSTQAV